VLRANFSIGNDKMSFQMLEKFKLGNRKRFSLETNPLASTAYVKPSVENTDRFPAIKMLNRGGLKVVSIKTYHLGF
jgi:hypothetical protein